MDLKTKALMFHEMLLSHPSAKDFYDISYDINDKNQLITFSFRETKITYYGDYYAHRIGIAYFDEDSVIVKYDGIYQQFFKLSDPNFLDKFYNAMCGEPSR